MKSFFRFSIAVCSTILTLAAPANAERATATIDNSYKGMESSFTTSSGYVLFAGLHKINDKIAVCGLIWYTDASNATSKQLEKSRSKYVQYHVDGKALIIHSADFKRYGSEDEAMASRKTGCTVTKRPWSQVKNPKSFELILPTGGNFTY